MHPSSDKAGERSRMSWSAWSVRGSQIPTKSRWERFRRGTNWTRCAEIASTFVDDRGYWQARAVGKLARTGSSSVFRYSGFAEALTSACSTWVAVVLWSVALRPHPCCRVSRSRYDWPPPEAIPSNRAERALQMSLDGNEGVEEDMIPNPSGSNSRSGGEVC